MRGYLEYSVTGCRFYDDARALIAANKSLKKDDYTSCAILLSMSVEHLLRANLFYINKVEFDGFDNHCLDKLLLHLVIIDDNVKNYLPQVILCKIINSKLKYPVNKYKVVNLYKVNYETCNNILQELSKIVKYLSALLAEQERIHNLEQMSTENFDAKRVNELARKGLIRRSASFETFYT